MGLASVSSQITQATKPTAATIVSTTMVGSLNQSAFLPRSSITCNAPTHSTSSTSPIVSIGSFIVGVSRAFRFVQHTIAVSTPKGTLMRKIHDQWKLSEI